MDEMRIQETGDGCELITGSFTDLMWIKPKPVTEEVAPFEALDLIESARDSICSIEAIDGADPCMPPWVKVTKLELPCPCCSEGKHLPIDRDQWSILVDWSSDEYQLLANELLDTIRKRHEFILNGPGCEEIVSNLNELLREKSFNANAKKDVETVYERLHAEQDEALREFDPVQLQLRFPGIPAGRPALRFQTTLLGIYRCPHCGNDYGVFLPDSKAHGSMDPNTVIRALDDYIERGQIRSRIRIESSKDKLIVDISNESNGCTIEFSREQGSVRLNGRRAKDEVLFSELLSRSCIDIGIFGNHEIFLKIASFLHPISESMDSSQAIDNVRLLMLANRFVGYPALFYERAARNGALFQCIYPAHSGFPRRFEHIEATYAMTGLPSKKSIRRRLFDDPIKLCRILQLRELPFENVDIINAFIDSPRFEAMVRALEAWKVHYHKDDISFWSEIARIKGEAVLLRFLQTQSEEDLTSTSRELMWMLDIHDPWVQSMVSKTPMHDFLKKLEMICMFSENPGLDLGESYEYTEEQKSFESNYGEFSFELPRSARDYLMAALELHNCMASYPRRMRRLAGHTVIFIKKGNRFLGGVELHNSKVVLQARRACNRRLNANDKLGAIFLTWCKEHGLQVADDEMVHPNAMMLWDF